VVELVYTAGLDPATVRFGGSTPSKGTQVQLFAEKSWLDAEQYGH
jgi:hypothetical protein